MPEDIVTELVEDAEKIFAPRPGGLVDTYRKDKAKREAAQKEKEQQDERIEEAGYKAVKVVQLKPEVVATNIVSIANGASGMILPASPYRYRAIIVSSVAIGLAKDQSQALGGIGFPIAANVPIIIESRAQLWGFANAGAATINILAEIYGPECY